ncbi:MAG TPA: ABC transporter ATP-binding protein [Gaiellaceae bacterium]|nr:ABC transporter ATP-binding protein [Gaiellaceae bacterium]
MSEPARGAIEVEHVGRRFRVYAQPVRTLKETLLARRRVRGREIDALTDVSFSVEPGEAVGLVGRNGSGKTTLLKIVAGIIKPTAGRVAVGGRIGSLLELGAGFHPEFTGAENVYLNGAILGLGREAIRRHFDEIVAFSELGRFIDLPVRTYSSGMVMRLGFAVAAHLDVDVLLLDEVFAVGDEEFQRKCFGKIFEFKQRGGTIVFVSHDAAAVERLCGRAVLLRDGRVAFDGPTREAIARYHALLAGERDPDERGAGLREYGSGELRIESVRLEGPDGEERRQFLPGEPLAVSLHVVSRAPVPPPRLAYELHDVAGLQVAAAAQDTAELGWRPERREHRLRLEVDSLPLADGRFRFRFELADASRRRLYHWLDDAAGFVVYPAEGETGLVRLDARWSLVHDRAGATIGEG